MTSRERMRTTVAGGKADRIPVAMVADFDFYCKAAGRPLWEYEYGDNAARAEIHKRAHLRFPESDFIYCWTGVSHKNAASRRVVMVEGRPCLEWTQTGKREPIQMRKTAAVWHAESAAKPTSQSEYDQYIICEADIELILGPVPTAQSLLEAGVYEPMEFLRRDLGDRAYISVAAHAIVPASIEALGGFERGMLAMHENPALVRKVVEAMAIRRSVPIMAAAQKGVDCAWIGGYLEGADMISPKLWREIAFAGHQYQVNAARQCGLQTMFWFLGDCMPLLDYFVELGIDALVIEQDRRGYCSDPVEVRKRIGNDLCITGWNWELDFINDRRANITREVERQIRGAGTDGAFIAGTTYMTSEVELGAVEHYCREVVRLGERRV